MADLGDAQEIAHEFVSARRCRHDHRARAADYHGLVVGDRLLRAELHTTAPRAYDERLALANRWHGQGSTVMR